MFAKLLSSLLPLLTHHLPNYHFNILAEGWVPGERISLHKIIIPALRLLSGPLTSLKYRVSLAENEISFLKFSS